MKLKYDNLEDARVKLVGTYCLYKGRAILIKHVITEEEEPSYQVIGTYMTTGRPVQFKLEDPDFNCSNYNIGYVNLYRACAWFYRLPLKQYRQGLRHDQVRMRYSKRQYAEVQFQASKAVAAMLENEYPKLEKAAELLREKDSYIVAFDKNFAMTYDDIHKDFILEYKGTNIGYGQKLNSFELMDEYKHLTESVKEATKLG